MDQARQRGAADDDLAADRVGRQVERLQLLSKFLNELGGRSGRIGKMAAVANDNSVVAVRLLHDPMRGHFHIVAMQEDRGDRVAVDLDQGDAAAHRNRAGRRVEGDVLLFADLAADIAEYAGSQCRRQVAVLLLRVEDEVVDNDFRVLRYGERRLIGEQQLRLAAVAGIDLLVMDDVVPDEEFALLAIRGLRGDVRVHLGGDADLVLLGQGRPAKARGPDGRKDNAV